ncbi:hypothetical protein [Nostoc sp.]|uniref:hypothetical protein n=1 Tax=Nostoc sp. TaxID=1180 RepID=UPI002FFCE33A
MDIALLVKVLAPCLPFLLKVGNKAVEGASQKVGEDVWNKAKAIWAKLHPKVEAKEAATDVAQKPEDDRFTSKFASATQEDFRSGYSTCRGNS